MSCSSACSGTAMWSAALHNEQTCSHRTPAIHHQFHHQPASWSALRGTASFGALIYAESPRLRQIRSHVYAHKTFFQHHFLCRLTHTYNHSSGNSMYIA